MSELPKGSFRLEGHIDVPADRIAQVSEALKDHIRLTREEAGCIFLMLMPAQILKGDFWFQKRLSMKRRLSFTKSGQGITLGRSE